jgi:hypothetical protein
VLGPDLREVFRKLGMASRTRLAHRVVNEDFNVQDPISAGQTPPHGRR